MNMIKDVSRGGFPQQSKEFSSSFITDRKFKMCKECHCKIVEFTKGISKGRLIGIESQCGACKMGSVIKSDKLGKSKVSKNGSCQFGCGYCKY